MFNREKRKANREAERFVDGLTASQGRDPHFFINDAERTRMMGIAMRWAMPWGIGAIIIIAGGLLYHWFDEQSLPQDAWVRLLVPPIVFFAAFFYKRRQMLDRAAAIWAAKRAQMIRETIKDRHKHKG